MGGRASALGRTHSSTRAPWPLLRLVLAAPGGECTCLAPRLRKRRNRPLDAGRERLRDAIFEFGMPASDHLRMLAEVVRLADQAFYLRLQTLGQPGAQPGRRRSPRPGAFGRRRPAST